jgi:hypothetical protein
LERSWFGVEIGIMNSFWVLMSLRYLVDIHVEMCSRGWMKIIQVTAEAGAC